MSTVKKTLARLYHNKPMVWVEYKTIRYSVEAKDDGFLLAERVQLPMGAWVVGREETFSTMDEIDSLLLPKFIKSVETSRLVDSQETVWYRMPDESTENKKAGEP